MPSISVCAENWDCKGEKNMSIPAAKQYIRDFENLGLGMFVHFGVYSQEEKGEWYGHLHHVDPVEYRKLAETFNPGSMEHIVEVAKSAGAKYITLTTKHHDGFCLFDAKGLTDFDVMHYPVGRDLVKEFVEACRKHDIVPFFYYATYEFWNSLQQDDFDAYTEYLRKSVEVLCTNYGKIGGLWFDGNWSQPERDWHEDALYATIRKYQPEAMIVNNTGLSARGQTGHPEIDSVTYERGLPGPINREGMEKYIAGEMCETLNNHWGVATDFNYKSPKTLIEELCDCRKVGANFLLNIGPDKDGEAPLMAKALMGTIGDWMKVYGEAVYRGRPYWYDPDCRSFALDDGDDVYLFCYDLNHNGSENVTTDDGGFEGGFTFKNFPDKICDVAWMDSGEKMDCLNKDGDLIVNLIGYKYGFDYCVRVAKARKMR